MWYRRTGTRSSGTHSYATPITIGVRDGGRRSDDESEHVQSPEHGPADVHVELCRVDATPEDRGGDGCVTVGA